MEYTERNRKRNGVSGVIVAMCCILAVAVGLLGGVLLVHTWPKEEASADPSLPVSPSPSPEPVVTIDTPPAFAYDGAYTRAQIVELCAPSVVGIDATFLQSYWGQNYEATGSGSGVILTADGYIATCAHVVEGAEKILVTLADESSYEAELVGADKRNDLAILKVEADDLLPASIGDSDMLTVGEDVIAIGNPLGELRGTATSGIISAVRRTIEVEDIEMELVQTDAAISPGNSGGGLFNAHGELIGIVNAKVTSSEAEGLGFAIPVNNVLGEINDLLNYGYVTGRAHLGVYTQNVTLHSDHFFFSGGTACVQVTDVVKDSAAEAAGLRIGDLILAVDDVEITSNTVLSDAISVYNAGDTAILTIQRSGMRQEVSVTFREYVPTQE